MTANDPITKAANIAGNQLGLHWDKWPLLAEVLRTAIEREREGCAAIAEAYGSTGNGADEGGFGKGAAEEIADAIRARSRA